MSLLSGGPSVRACIIHCKNSGIRPYRGLAAWGGTGSISSWRNWFTSPPDAFTLVLMNGSILFMGKEEVHLIQ